MIKQAKYQPGYVAAALADAYADVLRAKAQHKYNQSLPNITLTQAMPVPAGPSKSKTFAYTNIRLTAQATGEAPPPPPPPQAGPSFFQTVPSPFVTQQLPSAAAVSGARESPFVTSSAAVPASPFVTQQQQGVVPPLTTTAAVASPADLEAKLADLQAQLKQLQDLEDQIMAMKAGSTRRLLDSGLPGWDNGVLMQKVLQPEEGTAPVHEAWYLHDSVD